METILSEMNNKVDISTLKKSELKKLLKETKSTLKDSYYFLNLPLTEAEEGCYEDMAWNAKKDIEIMTKFLEK